MKRLEFNLRVKIFLGCFAVAVCIMVVSLVLMYLTALHTIENNATTYIRESMGYADANLNRMISDAEKISLAMATGGELLQNALFSNVDEASYEWFQIKKRAVEYLSSLISYKDHIVMSAVVRMDGRCIQTSGEMLLAKITLSDWFKNAANEPTVRIFYDAPSPRRIFLCRPIRYSGNVVAMAIVELDFDILSQCYQIVPLEQAQMVCYAEDGQLVFSNVDSYASGNIAQTPMADAVAHYREDQRYYDIGGEKQLLVTLYSQASGLVMVGTVPYRSLIVDALHVRSQMLMILLVSALLALLMSWSISRVIYKGIADMKRSMHNVQMGNLHSRIFVQGSNEISEMADIFNKMMDEILLLMDSLKRKEKQKRAAEQNALMAQIQPHFICNAINSIKYMAHNNGQQQIEEMSTALVELLRGVLGNVDEFVPLWQEAEYINDYVKIQQFKYSREYTVRWEVEEPLWSAMLPKLILQPVVENALLHGLADMPQGYVCIQIFETEGVLHCNITDNGRGMTQDVIEQLVSGTHSSGSQFRKIGFANVINRIKLIYGDSYGGSITSFPGEFTTVELTMPLHREGETP